jgi:hypothetical protein
MLRIAVEERGFLAEGFDENGRDGESCQTEVLGCRSWGIAIAVCLWNATLYPVEITGGQNFGEGQDGILANDRINLAVDK